MRILMIVAVLLLGLTAHARLGETEAQLLERFGKPWKRSGYKAPSKDKSYVWNLESGMGVTAWTYNGMAAWIEYYSRGPGNKLAKAEVQSILDANGAGMSWAPWKPGSKVWIRSDRKAIAEVEERKVTVYDVEFAKAVKTANQEAIAAIEARRAGGQDRAADAKQQGNKPQDRTAKF